MFCISIRTQTGRRLINQYYYGNWIKVCVCAFPQVLIFDRFGQDIISPLLSVKELRDMGITLHLWETNTLIEQTDKTNDCWSITLSFCVCVFSLLHSDRDPIPDVPAIYFVMPTEENIDRICQVKSVLSVPWFPAQASEPSVCVCVLVQDLRNQLYESYYLNFISAISRSKLEDIASAALASNAVSQVTKVTMVTFIFSLLWAIIICTVMDKKCTIWRLLRVCKFSKRRASSSFLCFFGACVYEYVHEPQVVCLVYVFVRCLTSTWTSSLWKTTCLFCVTRTRSSSPTMVTHVTSLLFFF